MQEEQSNLVELQPRDLPHNNDAEMQVLGAVLVNNLAYHEIADVLRPDHFYFGVHQRIFEAVGTLTAQGVRADPVTLKAFFEGDDGLNPVGGHAYLARLAGAATAIVNVRAYAEVIRDAALRREMIYTAGEVAQIARDMDVTKPIARQKEAIEEALFGLMSFEGQGGPVSYSDLITKAVQLSGQAYVGEAGATGFSTGIPILDRVMGRLKSGDLDILAGATSMGKSALAHQISENVSAPVWDAVEQQWVKGPAVLYFTPEMTGPQLAWRSQSRRLGVTAEDLEDGKLSERQWKELVLVSQELSRLNLHVDDTMKLTTTMLRSRVRRLMMRENVVLVVVDYLQKLVPDNPRASLAEQMAQISGDLKAIAKDFGLCVLALSQLNRKNDERANKEPQVSDMYGGSAIEKEADVVAIVHRPEYYLERSEPAQEGTKEWNDWAAELAAVKGLADILAPKRRRGAVGRARLGFEGRLTRFYDRNQEPLHGRASQSAEQLALQEFKP
jgi:replicative DNA helicase